MKPEKQNLIRDLLDADSNREDTLLAGASILRRRRHWRTARQGAAVMTLVLGVTVFCLRRETPHSLPSQVATVTQKSSPASEVRALSDDELLALFPNTPVGLASLANGKKRLIFPRAGDEQRFITRL